MDDSVKVVDFTRFKRDKTTQEYNWGDSPMNDYQVGPSGALVPKISPLSVEVFKALKGYKKDGFLKKLFRRIFK